MSKLKLLILTIALLFTASATPAASFAKITNGEQLIAAMHKKYAGKWYKTLTFVQKNTIFKPDGKIENSKWFEAMNAPGKLRIDFDPLESGNGILFTDGKQHTFKNGALSNSRELIHPLLVLGFDVYLQPVENTINQLKELKIDLSVLREDAWQGRPAYVVGAKAGDEKTAQFWIDKKNLYFVRMIEPTGKNKDHTQEIQFNKYQKVKGGGWIAPEVLFMVDGKRTFLEEYSDIQTNVKLDDGLFAPQNWMTADRKYYEIKR